MALLLPLKSFRNKKYRLFTRDTLRQVDYIFLALDEYAERIPEIGEFFNQPLAAVDGYLIQPNEKLLCFRLDYFSALQTFQQHNSLLDYMNYYNINGIWFVSNNAIMVYADIEYDSVYFYEQNTKR